MSFIDLLQLLIVLQVILITECVVVRADRLIHLFDLSRSFLDGVRLDFLRLANLHMFLG